MNSLLLTMCTVVLGFLAAPNQAEALAAPMISPLSATCTATLGLPSLLPWSSICLTMSMPSMTAQHH